MRRLLMLTPGELTRDPRARRAAVAATAAGYEVVGLCGLHPGDQPVALQVTQIVRVGARRSTGRRSSAGLLRRRRSSPLMREARGLARIARLAALNVRLLVASEGLKPLDIVHAHDVDTLPAAWLIGRRAHARVVYDAHEVYADQEPNPPRLQRAVVRRLERSLARSADAVVTVSEPIADELRRTLQLRAKPTVVLSCPARVEIEPAARGPGRLLAVYQGAPGPGRQLADLLEAAAGADETHLTIRLANAELAELRRAVAMRGLDGSVEIADPVPPDELVAALTGFHVGLVINRPLTRNDELVLPNKLFEYLMAGLAVVVPRLPGLADLVEREGVGLTYEPGRPDALAAALSRLARDAALLEELRRRARRLALERYNAELEAEALVRVWQPG
jgi:glycosyltransferase involved in cell wall biosynthesis